MGSHVIQGQMETQMRGDHEKGAMEIQRLAEKGMALFKAQEVQEDQGDLESATTFKAGVDAQIKQLNAEAEALTGKDNKKARTEKSKEASALTKTKEYIDAERILKGLSPKNGNFVKVAGTPTAAAKTAAPPAEFNMPPEAEAEDKKPEKKEKPKKEMEAAGISKAERDELEKLKNDIIALKKELKEQGMSGGQMNKDERVVAMVTRMNELKEKECPGSTAKKDEKEKKPKLNKESETAMATLTNQIEEYRVKLQTEFKYTKKEINADPDMADMVAALNKLKSGKK